MTSDITGRWSLSMRTPVGGLTANVTLTEESGVLSGFAEGPNETVRLHDVRTFTDNDVKHLSWQQSITKPLRLTLDFDVVISGDEMRGHSRAGRLPKTSITGHRISD